MSYTCKKCNKIISYKIKAVDGYKIKYRVCNCGRRVTDVLSPEGQSIKDIISIPVLERMLHSENSKIKIND